MSITRDNADHDRWAKQAHSYTSLTTDLSRDSEFLRSAGLVPNLLELIGDTEDKVVLDAGCGSGWLFDSLPALERWECDLTPPPCRPGINTSRQDITQLTYRDEIFDIVVSSLVLMWVEDLRKSLGELWRVTRPGGTMIVALVHPYFAHAGTATAEGFLINRALAKNKIYSDYYISGIIGPLVYYYRKPEEYYNEAIQAGWRLTHFRDWFLDMHDYETLAGGRQTETDRTGLVPTFSFFVGTK